MLLPGCSVLFLIQTAIIRMIKWKRNIYAVAGKKTISFAMVRNNAELIVSLTNWLSIYIVMYLHDPNILRKSMTMKCMLEV